MNIKLVKLTAEYKKQLTDMMDEWLAVEKDFSPYAIRKNDYHDFEYYLENLETKEGEKPGLVPDSVYGAVRATSPTQWKTSAWTP